MMSIGAGRDPRWAQAPAKEWLKKRLGERGRAWARSLSRVRWLAKYRVLKHYGVPLRGNIGYLLVDPEVGDFTYRIANVDEILTAIAGAISAPLSELQGYAHEADSDPELDSALARRLRWRFDVKHPPPLGYRLIWYVLVRALRPSLVCETGTYQGLGSLAILRALGRNAADGAPGELLSFDISPHAGWIVDRRLYPTWRHVTGHTAETLAPALAGRPVDILFHDTPHTEENQAHEFGVALQHAASRLVLFDGSGGVCPVLKQVSEEHGATYVRVPVRPAHHWFRPVPFTFAVLTSERTRQ